MHAQLVLCGQHRSVKFTAGFRSVGRQIDLNYSQASGISGISGASSVIVAVFRGAGCNFVSLVPVGLEYVSVCGYIAYIFGAVL